MPPLRIVVATDRFPELSETFVATEVRALRALGHDVRVEAAGSAEADDQVAYYLERGALHRKARDLVWLVARHPLRVLRDLRARRRWRRQEEIRPLRALAPAARRAARQGTQHVHVHFAAAAAHDWMRIAALVDVPYSVTAHAYDIFLTPANLAEKLTRAAFATTGCDYNVRALERIAPRADVHRIVMGVDGSRFARSTPYTGYGGHVLAVGRLVEKKGFRHLVEAAGEVGSPVTIVGRGPLEAELRELARAVGADVDFTGGLPPPQVRDLLEDADLLAMPCVVASDGDRDSMPVVVKEALAMEVPVVATDEVGLPEIVRPEWGRLVPPGDSRALAAALRELLALPVEDRAAMGRAGRAHVLEFANATRETEKLDALIAGAQPGRGRA